MPVWFRTASKPCWSTLFDLPQMLKTMISSTARQRVRVKAVTTLTSGHRLRPQRIEAKRNAM